jgi:hypothetical protein
LIGLDFGGPGLIAQALNGIGACEEQAIVPIPRFDLEVGRQIWTDKIEQPITAGAEALPPKCVVLLIDVQNTALPGHCSGKQDSIGVPAKVINESLRIAGVNVLADFERDNEIEPASNFKWLGEVVRCEAAGRNQESIPVDIVTIDSNRIRNTGALPFR